jgi:hypothetical protein
MFQPDQFKKSFNETFSKYFDSNFSKIEKYIDYDIQVFYELESTLIQQYTTHIQNHCIFLGLVWMRAWQLR